MAISPGNFKQSFYNGLRNYSTNYTHTQKEWRRAASTISGKKPLRTCALHTFSKKYANEMKMVGNYLNELNKRLSQPKRIRNAKSDLKLLKGRKYKNASGNYSTIM